MCRGGFGDALAILAVSRLDAEVAKPWQCWPRRCLIKSLPNGKSASCRMTFDNAYWLLIDGGRWRGLPSLAQNECGKWTFLSFRLLCGCWKIKPCYFGDNASLVFVFKKTKTVVWATHFFLGSEFNYDVVANCKDLYFVFWSPWQLCTITLKAAERLLLL